MAEVDLGNVMGEVNPDTVIEYTEPGTYTAPASGDSIRTIFGKITKGLADLFSEKVDKTSIVNNLLTTEEGFALDARQGAVLNNSLNNIGTTYSSYKSQADCAGSNWVLITGGASLSLPPGKYVLIASLLTKNTTARCIIQWAHNQARQQTMTGTTGLTYGMTLMDIIDWSGATENTSVNINGWQDMAVSYYDIMLVAIRII